MGALSPTPLPPRHPLFSRRMALGLPGALFFGLLATVLFRRLYTSVPSAGTLHAYHLIAASLAVDLAGLGVVLMLLPAWPRPVPHASSSLASRFPWLLAWLQSSLLGAAAFAGIALAQMGLASSGAHHESARTFVALGLLFAGQSGVLTGLHALLTTLLFPREQLARQALLLAAGALATTLFWSRGVIQAVERGSPETGTQRAEQLTDGAMKLSAPQAVCSVWFVESDAATQLTGGRFDLIHSPLTYREWVGITGKQVAYPDVLPPAIKSHSFSSENKTPGLALALILWSAAVIGLCDALRRRAA